jgi:MOSC domain-containing protein YiiM
MIAVGQRTVRTGIDKKPTLGPVQVTPLGLVGDEVSDQEHHGGPDQAVYVYTLPDYEYWTGQLGEVLEPGRFGENLTISGLESAAVQVGDRLHVGKAVTLEVTCPRIPCGVFATHMHNAGFVKKFRQAGRPGLYCRVIRTGSVQKGDVVTLEATTGPTVSVLEVYTLWYDNAPARSRIERVLAAPICIRTRQEFESRHARLG